MSAERPVLMLAILGLGVVSFTMSPILVRWAAGPPAMAIAVWRTGFAALLLAPLAWRRIRPEVRQFDRREIAMIIGAGVLLGLHFIAWIDALYYTTVASASVLVTTSPIFIALLGYWLLGERLAKPTVAAIVLSVGGAALIGLGDMHGAAGGSAPLWGNSLALLASLLASGYLLIGRVVRRAVSWLAYVFPLYTVAAFTTLIAALLAGTPLLGHSPAFYGFCLLMAIGPQIVGHGSFNYALHYFPAALVGMLALLEPVGSSALAFVLFGEVPRTLAVAGMLIVLGAVALIVWHRRTRSVEERSPASSTPHRASRDESDAPAGR